MSKRPPSGTALLSGGLLTLAYLDKLKRTDEKAYRLATKRMGLAAKRLCEAPHPFARLLGAPR